MLPILGLLLGVIAGLSIKYSVDPNYSKFVAIGILAALDTVVGGLTAYAQKNFNIKIFITGFFSNAIIAVLLTFIGNKLDLDLYLAAVIVFGTRLFNNFALLRLSLIHI